MNVMSVSCSKCGAPLNIPASVSFVTCSYCGASLTVKNSGGVVYTELLSRIGDNTDRMVHELQSMRLQNSVLSFDNSWQITKQDWMTAISNKQREMQMLADRAANLRANSKGFQAIGVDRQCRQSEQEYSILCAQYQESERRYHFERYLLQNDIVTVPALDAHRAARKHAAEADLTARWQHLQQLKEQASGFGKWALKSECKKLEEEFERQRAAYVEEDRLYLLERQRLQTG